MPITKIRTAEPDFSDLFLRIDLPGKGADQGRRPTTDPDNEQKLEDSAPLICARCSAPITTRGQAIEINGQHEHAFFNPAGIAYELRCFRRAPGCLVQGNPTSEFTWFASYQWQFCLCSTCLIHLGWFFSSTELGAFHGLIKNRLI